MYTHLLAHISKHVALDADERALVTTFFEPRQLKRKALLLEQGQVSTYEAYVNKGCLRAFYTDDKGEEHLIRFAVEDWWMGELSSFHTQTPSLYTIEALEDCHLLLYTRPGKDALLDRLPKLEKFFRLLYQTSTMALQRRIIHHVSQTAEERYTEFTAMYPRLDQRLPQYMVASYLGITPQYLSQIRRKFAGS